MIENYDLSTKIIALSGLKGMGRKRTADFLEDVFSKRGSYDFTFEDISGSKISQLKNLIKTDLTKSNWDFQCNKAKEIIDNSLEKKIATINFKDAEYPKELAVLPKKPLVLFVKGNIKLLTDTKKVAVIGTRQPSVFAQKMTSRITEQLSKLGYTVVSGLAVGCDSLAHEMASITNGKTIAILAHGLDVPIYPKVNRPLADDILRNGGILVSEYPIGTTLRPSYLVERDEWQSGMSLGTITIESSNSGGSRHATYKALEQDRALAVLDHTLFKNGKGWQVYFSNDSAISLNQQLLAEKKAFPLYSLDSIFEFDKKMQSIKEKVNKKYSRITTNKTIVTTNKQDNIIQTSLF